MVLPMVIPQETAASAHSLATPRESRGSPWIPTSVGEMYQSGKVYSSNNNSNNNSIYWEWYIYIYNHNYRFHDWYYSIYFCCDYVYICILSLFYHHWNHYFTIIGTIVVIYIYLYHLVIGHGNGSFPISSDDFPNFLNLHSEGHFHGWADPARDLGNDSKGDADHLHVEALVPWWTPNRPAVGFDQSPHCRDPWCSNISHYNIFRCWFQPIPAVRDYPSKYGWTSTINNSETTKQLTSFLIIPILSPW